MVRILYGLLSLIFGAIPSRATLRQIGFFVLMTLALATLALTFSMPRVEALPKFPKRSCDCGCQYKEGGKWIEGNSQISFSSSSKCETHNGGSTTCRKKAGGENVQGRLSHCSITGIAKPPQAGGVPDDGGVVEPGQKNPGATSPDLPDAATER